MAAQKLKFEIDNSNKHELVYKMKSIFIYSKQRCVYAESQMQNTHGRWESEPAAP